jgi:hypothetical protein
MWIAIHTKLKDPQCSVSLYNWTPYSYDISPLKILLDGYKPEAETGHLLAGLTTWKDHISLQPVQLRVQQHTPQHFYNNLPTS